MSDCKQQPPLAVVRSYDELHSALRARAEALNVSRQTLDEVSGLQSGYCAKLLAPVPIKGIGRITLAPLLGALGLKLVVVVDEEMMAQISRRMVKREATNAAILAGKTQARPSVWKGNSAWGKMMQARSMLLMTEEQRKRRAKRAIKTRWAKRSPRVVRD